MTVILNLPYLHRIVLLGLTPIKMASLTHVTRALTGLTLGKTITRLACPLRPNIVQERKLVTFYGVKLKKGTSILAFALLLSQVRVQLCI